MADATVATDVRTRLAALTVEEFTERLASAEPVPGGGSASAIAASLAASLLAMVAALTVGRPKYSDYAAGAEQAAAVAADLRHRFLRLADADAEAYTALVEAMRLPRDSDAERAARAERIRAAARVAAEVPLEVVRSAEDLAAGIEQLAGRSNINDAAAHGAAQNVLVNLPSVEDGKWEGRATVELDQRLDEIERLTSLTREVTGRGTLRDPEAA
jgi:formiminotetrahydrofolate cyclodeaminase